MRNRAHALTTRPALLETETSNRSDSVPKKSSCRILAYVAQIFVGRLLINPLQITFHKTAVHPIVEPDVIPLVFGLSRRIWQRVNDCSVT